MTQNELLRGIDTCFNHGKSQKIHFSLPSGSSAEAYEVLADFNGQQWWELSRETLLKHDSPFAFLPVEAAFYYLPAFLKLAIEDPDAMDVTLDSLVLFLAPLQTSDSITPGDESLVSRHNEQIRWLSNAMDQKQRQWVAGVLQALAGQEQMEIEGVIGAKQALSRYWSRYIG